MRKIVIGHADECMQIKKVEHETHPEIPKNLTSLASETLPKPSVVSAHSIDSIT